MSVPGWHSTIDWCDVACSAHAQHCYGIDPGQVDGCLLLSPSVAGLIEEQVQLDLLDHKMGWHRPVAA